MPSKVGIFLFLVLTNLLSLTTEAQCFSWRPQRLSDGQHPQRSGDSSSFLNKQSDQRLSSAYNTALQELQDLESEPLCHRIAARLLVNNCHLLDGQGDAKIHIDSGRAARDFVDSYAASLAICDLERGSFRIPNSCSKFRESVLVKLSVPTVPQLHVSTIEIDECLEGFAQSDSAWNTWVSYRHKALRFCDAARVDHQKDENIFLYQKITKILERLTHDIETDMEERFQSLNRAFNDASQSIENIGPQVQHLRTEMVRASRILRDDLNHAVQDSRDVVRNNLKETQVLHELLELLVRSVQEKTADIALSQEVALQTSTKQLNNEVEILMAVLNTAVSSSVSLQSQVEMTESRSADILEKQSKIEEGMDRLGELAEDLLVKYDNHESRLDKALRKSGQVLELLDAAAASANGIQGYIFGGFGLSGFWPHVLCPVLSLMMGSYGLQPSLVRNIWLLGFDGQKPHSTYHHVISQSTIGVTLAAKLATLYAAGFYNHDEAPLANTHISLWVFIIFSIRLARTRLHNSMNSQNIGRTTFQEMEERHRALQQREEMARRDQEREREQREQRERDRERDRERESNERYQSTPHHSSAGSIPIHQPVASRISGAIHSPGGLLANHNGNPQIPLGNPSGPPLAAFGGPLQSEHNRPVQHGGPNNSNTQPQMFAPMPHAGPPTSTQAAANSVAAVFGGPLQQQPQQQPQEGQRGGQQGAPFITQGQQPILN
ncbi:hypothetical protein F53441_8913, partial [Fusarium austroafricanum]